MSDIDAILKERGAVYGDFMEQAGFARAIKRQMRGRPSYRHLLPDMEEALEMIAVKIARILNGDPNHTDSWDDIAGYAQLVANRLRGDK